MSEDEFVFNHEPYDIVGLANAVTDIVVQATYDDIKALNWKHGFSNSYTKTDKALLQNLLSTRKIEEIPGGSPANTIRSAAVLGMRSSLLGTVGSDEYAATYMSSVKSSGVDLEFNIEKGASGLCYIMVTPEGEKTFTATMGVASHHAYTDEQFKKIISRHSIVHTSGYELTANPDAILRFLSYASSQKAKISFDLADPAIVKNRLSIIQKILPSIEVLFMTEEESEALTGLKPIDALDSMSKTCKRVALKKGSDGSIVREGVNQYEIPIYPCKLVNTIGAGDTYAAGFLTGHSLKLEIEECGHMGSMAAAKVCARKDPHL